MDKETEITNVKLSYSSELVTDNVPIFKEARGKDWIPYSGHGKPDGYPDYLIQLKNSCSWHSAILDYKIQQIAGKGFIATGSDAKTLAFLDNINPNFDANEILEKVAHDKEMFGGFAFLITWSNDWKKIAVVEHVAFDKIRCGKVDNLGHINQYYYAYDWSKQRGDKQIIPAFDPNGAKTKAIDYESFINTNNVEGLTAVKITATTQLLYYRGTSDNNFYYPLPSYIACLSSIRADVNSDIYGEKLLENQMSTPMHVNVIGNFTPTQKIEEASNIIDNYTGARRAGTPLITFSKEKELSVEVTKVENDSSEDRYKSISEAVRQKILSGHRVTSPLLMGIALAGTLGNRDELQAAYEVFYVSVIQPEQNQITKVFNKIMAINKLKDLSIDRLSLFDDATSADNNNELAPADSPATTATPAVDTTKIGSDNTDTQNN